MSKLIPALMETLFFFAIASLVTAQTAAAVNDANATAVQVTLYGLVATIFFLGGVWSIAAVFGMVPPPSKSFSGGGRKFRN